MRAIGSGAGLTHASYGAYVIAARLLAAAVGFELTILLTPTSNPALIATALALVALGAGMGLALSNDVVIIITGVAGTGVMVLAATWALVMLRDAAANKDLAAQHEDEL